MCQMMDIAVTENGKMENDYISRQAAIEAIGKITRTTCWKAAAALMLVDVPAADVIEVVRCKDCKYWKTIESVNFGEKIKFCTYVIDYSYARQDVDFCSRGERKEQ